MMIIYYEEVQNDDDDDNLETSNQNIATQKTACETLGSSMRVAQSECADDCAQIERKSFDPNSD